MCDRNLVELFPNVVEFFQEKHINDLIEDREKNRNSITLRPDEPEEGIPVSFANTLYSAKKEKGLSARISAWRLKIIDLGLKVVMDVGNGKSGFDEMLTDGEGFLRDLAELYVIASFAEYVLELEVPSASEANNKDHDLLCGLRDERLHMEVKRRNLFRDGKMTDRGERSLRDLLSITSPGCLVHLNKNNLSDDDVERISTMVDEASNNLILTGEDQEITWSNVESMPESLCGWAIYFLQMGARPYYRDITSGVRAIYLPKKSKFVVDDEAVQSLEFKSNLEGVVCFPDPETRASFSKESRESFHNSWAVDVDKETPELVGVRDLIRSTPKQLAGGSELNVVALNLPWVTESEIEQVKYALYGEPWEENGEVIRKGGLWDKKGWGKISGVAIFSFYFPAQRGARPGRFVKFFKNPECKSGVEISDERITIIKERLETPVVDYDWLSNFR